MKRLKIALIPGDGIGKEVLQEGVKVLKTIDKIDNNLFLNLKSSLGAVITMLRTEK